MRGILSAVAYMHEKGIVHRDLKPDNILVNDRSDLNTCRVIDFGLSAKHNLIQGGLDKQCGTVIYMAPEIIAHNYEYTKSVDIWAIGIIMYELLTGGKHPLYVNGEDN
jgi:serine/threonine protein kinase